MQPRRTAALAGLAFAVVALATFVLWPRPSAEAAFGAPGDAGSPSRTVEILIRERPDGRMYFLPDAIELRRGEQLHLIIRNEGERPHYVLVAPEGDILRAAAQLRISPRATLPGQNGVRLVPGQLGEIFWRFTQAGELEFSSVLPGDREAGLYGRLVVR